MESQEKKKYTPPEIIFETDLETKAGSVNSPIVPGGNELDILPGAEG
jgi:hypothetical protein